MVMPGEVVGPVIIRVSPLTVRGPFADVRVIVPVRPVVKTMVFVPPAVFAAMISPRRLPSRPLSLVFVTVNVAALHSPGSAISNTPTSEATNGRSTFSDNEAISGNSGRGNNSEGGAIFNDAPVTVS